MPQDSLPKRLPSASRAYLDVAPSRWNWSTRTTQSPQAGNQSPCQPGSDPYRMRPNARRRRVAGDGLSVDYLGRDGPVNFTAVVRHELCVEEVDQFGLFRPELFMDVLMEFAA